MAFYFNQENKLIAPIQVMSTDLISNVKHGKFTL